MFKRIATLVIGIILGFAASALCVWAANAITDRNGVPSALGVFNGTTTVPIQVDADGALVIRS